MRSFAGILQRDGAPPDARLLARLASAIRLPSSPEAEIALDEHCGLAAVPAIARDGVVWVAADSTAATEDVLRVWQRWGSDCVAHLSGDFSFAVWNGTELFCARDHFGARPFFYAQTERAFVFSDSLEAVLAHPGVPEDELDDVAVADYLASGVYEDAQATIFAQVRRLPPAHTLAVRYGELMLRRYWTLHAPAIDRRRDAPARLESALRAAITERVTGPSAVTFMSGGLDSPTLAALAREGGVHVHAATSAYRTRIRDVEEAFAVEAARSIGISHSTFVLDDYGPLNSLQAGLWTADPGALLTASVSRDVHVAAAEHAPVAMHGHPADAVLAFEPMPYLRTLFPRPIALAAALAQYTAVKRRPPYFFIRELLGRPRRSPAPPQPPDWLRVPPRAASDDAREPLAIRALGSPMWSSYFEWAHPLVTRAPIELVYPWADPGVIQTALAMPPVPWLIDKHVLRELLRGRVSETIRRRPKTFLQGDPSRAALPPHSALTIEAAARYIDPIRLRAACDAAGSLTDETLRAVAFEYWLRALPKRVSDLRQNGAGTCLNDPMSPGNEPGAPTGDTSAKREYVPPKLEKLGTISELTRGVGMNGSMDGGHPPGQNKSLI